MELKEQIAAREAEIKELKAQAAMQAVEAKQALQRARAAAKQRLEIQTKVVKEVKQECYAFNRMSVEQKRQSNILKKIQELVGEEDAE